MEKLLGLDGGTCVLLHSLVSRNLGLTILNIPVEESVRLQLVLAAPRDKVKRGGRGAAHQDVDDQDHAIAELIPDEPCRKRGMDNAIIDLPQCMIRTGCPIRL